MKKSNFALRLLESLLKEARSVAAEEGVALNQLRTADYFHERARRGDDPKHALELLKRTGVGRPPDSGDEIGTR